MRAHDDKSNPTPLRPPGVPPGRERQAWASVIFGVLLGLFVMLNLMLAVEGPVRPLEYSRFLELVEEGQVERAAIGAERITGVYRERNERVHFVTTRPPEAEDRQLVPLLREEGVEFTGSRPSGLARFVETFVIAWLLPLALIIGLWVFFMRRFRPGGGAMTFGRARHKVYDREDLKTGFHDVAGLDEAVEELGEVVDFLRRPERYAGLGARIPKGVLLVGPPGTGKTLLARAVAGEAGVPFFYMPGSSFVEMFVGLGAARVRELFEEAKAKAPCLIFIDEIDTIGKARGGAASAQVGGHDEREQTLTQLLTEMDGFDASAGVIIMAATNRPEVLDQALLRPGRFDRQVVVDRPDRRGRAAILQVHARRVRVADDVDLELVAARTPGFAGAELANVVNEAALLAARRDRSAVTMNDLEEAIDRVSMGLERRSRVITPAERRRVAYHELGHAVVALSCPHADPVHRVSIVPRGVAALGVTQQLPAEDRHLLTRPELEDRLAVMMGGRAAERLIFGDVSSGAQNDLQQATALARRMVEQFGMSERVGPVALSAPDTFLDADTRSEARPAALAAVADEEVQALLRAADERAHALLAERRDDVERLARMLLERETIEGPDLEAALAGDTGAGDVSAPDASASTGAQALSRA